MAIGDIYRLRLNLRVASMDMYIYFHMKAISAATKATNLVDLWTGAASTEWSQFAFMISSDAKFIEAEAAQITNGGLDYAKKNAAQTLFGSAPAGSLPLNNVSRINWRTGFPGRTKRGYNLICPISNSRHNSGYLIQAQIANMQAWINNFLGRYGPTGSGVNWRFGVFSRKVGGYYPNANPAGWTQITSGSFDAMIHRCEKRLVNRAASYNPPFL